MMMQITTNRKDRTKHYQVAATNQKLQDEKTS